MGPLVEAQEPTRRGRNRARVGGRVAWFLEAVRVGICARAEGTNNARLFGSSVVDLCFVCPNPLSMLIKHESESPTVDLNSVSAVTHPRIVPAIMAPHSVPGI